MEIELGSAELKRRPSVQSLVRMLEYALSGAYGFSVSVTGMKLWASPGVLEERNPRYEVRDATPRPLPRDPTQIMLPFERRLSQRGVRANGQPILVTGEVEAPVVTTAEELRQLIERNRESP